MSKYTKTYYKNFIRDNKIEQLFSELLPQLQQYAIFSNDKLTQNAHDQLILLAGKWKSILQEEHLNIADPQEAEREKARVHHSVLQLINQLPEHFFTYLNSEDKTKIKPLIPPKRNKYFGLGGLVVFILIVGAFFLPSIFSTPDSEPTASKDIPTTLNPTLAKEERYQQLLTRAENQYQATNYAVAKRTYTSALAVADSFALNAQTAKLGIEKCEKAIKKDNQQGKQKTTTRNQPKIDNDANYQKYLTEGDKYFLQGDYPKAKKAYGDAQNYKNTSEVRTKIADCIKKAFTQNKQEEEVFKLVEQMPRFIGCENISGTSTDIKQCADKKMLAFINDNIKYPETALSKGIEGTCVIQFIVEKDGRTSNYKLTKDIGSGCGEEALRVVKLMSKWIPGKQRGAPVRVLYNVPVKFKLS